MTVASAANKVTLNGNGATTSWPFSFRIFDSSDLEIYKTDTAGAQTEITSNFSVVVNGESGGTVTYPSTGSPLASGETITIIRVTVRAQSVDFTSQGAFLPQNHEDADDRAMMILQELDEKVDRAFKLPTSDTSGTATELTTDVTGSAGGVLYIQAGVLKLSESANIDNLETLAGISGDITTVAANDANITTVANNLNGTDTIGTVAGSIANVNNVGNNISNVVAVDGNATNINAAVANATNINTVAGISANVTTVAGISADVTAVAADAADIGVVSANIADVNTVAGISANVTTVATDTAAINTVATDLTGVDDIGTVATNISNVNAVGSNISDITNAVSQAAAGVQRNTYTGDNSTVTFVLPATPWDADVVFAYLDGVNQDNSEWSVSGSDITFNTAPGAGVNIELVVLTAGTVTAAQTSASNAAASEANAAASAAIAAASEKGFPQVDLLADLKALTAAGFSAGDVVYMRGRTTVGDAGAGLFTVFTGAANTNEWLNGKATAGTSTGTAMVSDDGIVVQNTAGDLTFVRVLDNEVNTAWYGADPSASAADNTTAFNAAFNFLRARIYGLNSNENSVPTVMTPPGVYEVNSINATQIRAAGWSWIGSGATIKGVGAGKAVVDLLHSRQFTLNGITVEGDTTNKPRLGFQTGYMAGQTSSGSYHFIGVFTKGQFSLAAYLNGGGEEISHVGCQFENEDSASTSYSVIEDGWNFWGKRSDYISRSATNDHLADSVEGVTQANPAVVTLTGHSFSNGDVVMFRDVGGMTELNGNYYTVANATANTFELSGVNSTGFTAYTSGGFVHELKPESFVQSQFNNCAAFKSVGGPAVWQSGNVDRHAWVSSYILSKDSHGVVQKIDPTIQSKYPQHTHLDVGFEGTSLQHALYFDRTGTSNLTFNMAGLYIKDHGPQTDTALIGTNDASASSIYSFIGGHIELANFAGASVKVVDTQAKFRFTGDFISRNTAAITDFPEPFFGRMMIPDANTSALPEGSYDLVTPVNNGSESEYSIRKGVHRFYGDDAAIASGSLSSGDYVELAGEYVKLPNLTSNPPLVEGTFFYRNDLLKIYDGAYNQTMAMGPAVGSMATDTAVSIDIPGPGNVSAMAVISCDGSAGPHALVWVRGTSAACSLFSTAQANVTVTTGVLTGTTGTSGDFTISAHSDGKMYLENRQATTLVVNVTWMSVTQ